MSTPDGHRTGLPRVLAAFAVLAFLHALLLPLFEGPDEPDNLRFIRFLAVEGRLTQPATEPTYELEQLGRGHMPPLWFLSMVPVFSALGVDEWDVTATRNPAFYRLRAADGKEEVLAVLRDPASRLHFRHGRDERHPFAGAGLDVRILRWLSIPWALIALVAVWHIALRLTRDPVRATWVTALGASLPQLQHLSGTLTMDLMLAAWGALALYACVEWCSGEGAPARWAALAGVATALAALTKLNGLVLVPACGLAALFAWRAGRGFLRPLVTGAVAFALVAGPYYVWGWLESGHPLWSWHYQGISPFHTRNLPEATSWGLEGIAVFTMSLFVTWFADFGWTAVWFPTWVLVPFGVLTAVGAAVALARSFGAAAPWRNVGLALGAATLLFGVWMTLEWVAIGRERFETTDAGGTAAVVLLALILVVAGVFGVGGALRRARLRQVTGRELEVPASGALGFLVASAALILAAEVWFNLRFAQPQARHLYPFLPALVVPVAIGLERVRLLRAAVVVQVVLSVAALPLLLGRMRHDGWNESAIWSATDLERRADPSLTDDREGFAGIEWVEPEHRASFPADEPPTIVWKIDDRSEYDVVAGLRPELENRPWRPDGPVLRSIAVKGLAPRGSLEIPDSLWSALRPGASLYLQVIALGEDGAATGRSTVLELRRAD